MTEYRKVNDGFVDWLQFKATSTFLFFFKKERWVRVPVPYYDKVWGRSDLLGYNIWVCDYNSNIARFVERWPNIEEYLLYYKEEQSKLVEEAKAYWEEHNKRKGVAYL